MERQIRIEGKVKKVSRADTEAYFATRPVGSQLGAWASPQSEVIPSREVLEQNWTKAENVFKDKTIPAPEHWGGYELEPHKLEFWQGRSSRMHDRICYTLHQDGWQISRLAP